MEREPAQIVGYITAAATAIIALLVSYQIDISQQQQTAILGVVAVVAPIVASLIIRFNVVSPATAKKVADESAQVGKVDPLKRIS